MRKLAAVTFVAAMLSAAFTGLAHPSSLPPSKLSAAPDPGALSAAAVNSMIAQHSYHYVASSKVGTRSLTIVGDAAPVEGIQQITFSQGSRSGHVTVIVTSTPTTFPVAYFRGDAFALASYMGFPAASAARYAGHWLRLTHLAPGFAAVSRDVLLGGAAVEEIQLPSPMRISGSAVIDGQPVIGVQATIHQGARAGTETVYVRRSGSGLPVEMTIVYGGKLVTKVVFSRWNEPVTVTVPGKAISLP